MTGFAEGVFSNNFVRATFRKIGFAEESYINRFVTFSTTDFAEIVSDNNVVSFKTIDFAKEVFANYFVTLFTTDSAEEVSLYQLYRCSLQDVLHR